MEKVRSRVVSMAAVMAAWSGAASAAPPADRGETVVEDVVVTATRRDVGVQELPASVTAITSERLDELNAQSLADYFRTVPGLMVNSTGAGNNRLDFSLRGVSDFSALAPVQNVTVGQYLDEIPTLA